MKLQLDVVIPVRNEADNVEKLVRRLDAALTSAAITYRLIFIDDHSTDATASLLKRLANRYPIIMQTKAGRPGKAFSILEGAKLAQTEYIAMIDGDLQYPPEALPGMLALTPQNGVVVANRKIRHTSPLRTTISGLNRQFFGRLLLGLPMDVQSGLKVFRRDLLNYLDPADVDPWAIDMPLLHTAVRMGYSVGTVDIEFLPRAGGASKLRIWSASAQIGLRALKLKFGGAKVYPILPPSPDTPIGAGIIHHGRRYITHTRIPLSHSAAITFSGWQKATLVYLACILIICLLISPQATAIVFMGLLTAIYFVDIFFNLYLVTRSLRSPPEYSFSPPELARLKDSDLPVYSILCPLYREARV